MVVQKCTHLFVILIIFIVASICLLIKCWFTIEQGLNKHKVYGVMVTGKTPDRIEQYAKHSILQFFENDGNNDLELCMIVVNHSNVPVKPLLPGHVAYRVFEYMLHPKALSLGEMRNLALTFVPYGEIWVTWDDDDWRHPDFLSGMLISLYKTDSDAIAFCNRYEYNKNNDFSFRMQLKSGFPLMMCRSNPLIRYSDKPTMEDLNFPQKLQRLGLDVAVLTQNPPQWYIRLIHEDNTSLYVDKDKRTARQLTGSVYGEFKTSPQVHQWIRRRMSKT